MKLHEIDMARDFSAEAAKCLKSGELLPGPSGFWDFR
jgi:hypothetical protein